MLKYTRRRAAFLGSIITLLSAIAACETVEIVALDVATIDVEPNEVSLAVGEQRRLTASVQDDDGNPLTGYTISWSSSDADIAIIGNDGTLRAIGEGIAEITARVNGTGGTAAVTVTASPIIGLAPQAVTFAATLGSAPPASRVVRITNNGPGTLDGLSASVGYAAGQPTGWLGVTLDATAAPADLRLTVASGGLEAGRYEATVTIGAAHPGVAPRPLPVELIVGEPLPVIDVDADAVNLRMVAGGASPPPRSIAVTNAGGGTLSGLGSAVTYATDQPTGWLSASLSPSTAPATLVLAVSGAALAPGTYSADVAIVAPEAANSPRVIAVTLVVEEPPRISLSATSRTFTAQAGGTDPAPQTFVINNAGGGELTGLAAAVVYPQGQATGWLDVELAGTTAPTTATLEARVGSLPEGTHTGIVVINAPGASNSPQSMQVSFVVGAAPPSLAISRDTVTFQAVRGGNDPAGVAIQVTNVGGGSIAALTAAVAHAQGQPTGWLAATLGSTTAPAMLTLDVSIGSLATGVYNATVTVAANGVLNSPRTIAVTFIVVEPAPVITLAQKTANFQATAGGANPPAQNIQITNGGGGSLTGLAASTAYAAGQPAGWLDVSLGSTTAPAALALSATTGSLATGVYGATVTITAPGAANSPQAVHVSFVVGDPPAALSVSPANVTFNATEGGPDPSSAGIVVSNAGGGGPISGLATSIAYEPGQTPGWLTASLSGSTTTAALTLDAATAGLAAGTYNATVSVEAPGVANSPQTVSVTFVVAEPPPAIALSATTATLNAVAGSATPVSTTIDVTNSGGGTLTGLAATIDPAGDTWLNATIGGTEPATLSLEASAASLPAGPHVATVTITAPGASNSPQQVTVTFNVAEPPPAIALSATTATLNAVAGSATPVSTTIDVTNSGGGTLTGLAATIDPAGDTWLNATIGGTEPATLSLEASAASLAAGPHVATVTITAPGASNSPQQVTVTFNVAEPPPAIALSATTATLNAVAGSATPVSTTIDVTNSGGGTLTGLAVTIDPAGDAWLNATVGATAPAILSLEASAASLAAGPHVATVTITAPGASNSPQQVTVTFNVAEPAPAIALSATTASFAATAGGGNPPSQNILITNGGGGSLTGLVAATTYGDGEPIDWLAATLNQTTAPATLTLQPATGTLTAGTYIAIVTITAPGASNSPLQIQVTFEVSGTDSSM